MTTLYAVFTTQVYVFRYNERDNLVDATLWDHYSKGRVYKPSTWIKPLRSVESAQSWFEFVSGWRLVPRCQARKLIRSMGYKGFTL